MIQEKYRVDCNTQASNLMQVLVSNGNKEPTTYVGGTLDINCDDIMELSDEEGLTSTTKSNMSDDKMRKQNFVSLYLN